MGKLEHEAEEEARKMEKNCEANWVAEQVEIEKNIAEVFGIVRTNNLEMGVAINSALVSLVSLSLLVSHFPCYASSGHSWRKKGERVQEVKNAAD